MKKQLWFELVEIFGLQQKTGKQVAV